MTEIITASAVSAVETPAATPPSDAPPPAPTAPVAATVTEPVSAAAEHTRTAPAPVSAAGARNFFWGTGRRKSSVARVRLVPGQGAFLINQRKVEEFFRERRDRNQVQGPLTIANLTGKLDISANVHGGGCTGQAGAIAQGLGRALSLLDPALRKPLQDAGFLTRDSRMKERKKYGLRGARRAFQFSKR